MYPLPSPYLHLHYSYCCILFMVTLLVGVRVHPRLGAYAVGGIMVLCVTCLYTPVLARRTSQSLRVRNPTTGMLFWSDIQKPIFYILQTMATGTYHTSLERSGWGDCSAIGIEGNGSVMYGCLGCCHRLCWKGDGSSHWKYVWRFQESQVNIGLLRILDKFGIYGKLSSRTIQRYLGRGDRTRTHEERGKLLVLIIWHKR